MLEPRYEHKEVEDKIYSLWEKSGYFNPDNLPVAKNAKPFTIIMPPPNANGSLHIGHAVFVTLQDILTRFWRMRGRKALWLPGADHAGFETQVVFDKKLEKEGRSRFKMTRDEAWKEMWEFTQKNKVVMENQLRKLGASADWSREKFTLDPRIVEEVQNTFVKMYEDGLIYRGMRIVNWCSKHKTALSDLEVKYIERKDPLYYIKYGPLTLATVRPETKFGDTALAVNPKDKRYQKYIGKEIEAIGLLGKLKFKVIADDAVDPKFGTGVVKVTPAHDTTDFEIWQRHKDEISGPKTIIDENGRLTRETGTFTGLKVAEAREKVAEAMKEKDILEKIEPEYVHQVATCYKCGTTLEPLPKQQWFVKMEPLAKKALTAVQSGKIKFYPDRSKKVYFHWLKNIRDWNISRQIVWGIRIPAWFCLSCDETKMNPKIKSRWFLVRHGESEFNKEHRHQGQMKGNPLSAEGIVQVQKTAKLLKEQNIDLVISSDIERCEMTAKIIAEETGAKLVFDERLREQSTGVAEGMMKDEFEKKYGDIFSKYEERIPGGETWKELEERIWKSFNEHQKNHKHMNVVIVTHGSPISYILGKIKNIKGEDLITAPFPKNAEVVDLVISEPCKKCGGDIYEQDPDVFDTWFSSGQWPYLTLGYPKGKDFKNFYPTDVMETAYDILFFWVARMIMFGIYRTGHVPFKSVYLHGLVRDKDRQKMSKSKGNVVDPLGVSEIYGTDAVRMALVAGNTAGNDIIISEEKIKGYRNFATKIWNVSRFILMNKPSGIIKSTPSAEDKKNLAQLKKIKTEITKHLERFEFHLASEKIYHYFWHTFADKIIEGAKPRLRSNPSNPLGASNEEEKAAAYQTLETILIECLKMLHPFMPFITEEIWQKLKPGEPLIIAEW
ncbi:MAG: class I tRNA ligase family protein [Patescibacteria group bacterium]|nr:class I tRNA ligase family protein [Patescibacteria group bacterium]MDE2014916.1 class I tRNA ligase family protein [Patescibacteria group bacterium]MDE2226345.1 class I tRNA ligase family protein [Patescibacteria group bacterium]